MLSNTLIDNSDNLKLVDTLNEIIAMPELKEISIATGYWDLKGTALITDSLKNFLKKDNTKLRLLIGKDPNLYKWDLTADSYKSAKTYPKDYIKIDLENVELNKPSYQNAAEMLLDYCSGDNPKIEVHIFNTNENDEKQFFHSKCYIFTDSADEFAYGIIGSSNFTEKGLNGNSELNYLETNSMIINYKGGNTKKGHLQWFNEKWAVSDDWTKEFIVTVQNSPVGKEARKGKTSQENNRESEGITVLSPKETYYKLLINQFDSYLNYDGKIKTEDFIPNDPDFKQLNYQIQAVNQAFGILESHHGVIIADVVGLGKTYTALMIVKRYLVEHNFNKTVLIITPPAIKKSWIKAIDYFDENSERKLNNHITLTTIGCLDTEANSGEFINIDDFDSDFSKTDYGMVVIDESHRFRNSNTIMYQKLEDLLVEHNPYVVLLSATPQNNRPVDIANQIYLFEHNHRDSSIHGLGEYENNLESYFTAKENIYDQCIKDKDTYGNKKTSRQKENDMKVLKEIANQIRDDVLNQILIRRTRTDLMTDLYKEDLKKQGIVFPKIEPPKGIPYEMTGSLADLFIETVDIIASKAANADTAENDQITFNFKEEGVNCLGYYRYRAIQFLKDEKNRKRYEYDSKRKRKSSGSITATGISERLAGLMELHLVKRLESSRDAFEESLNNLKTNTGNMIKMFEKGRVFICPDLDVHKIINSYPEAEIDKAFDEIRTRAEEKNRQKNTDKNAEYKPEDFTDEYLQNLRNDLVLMNDLSDKWAKNKQDKKRDAFIKNIDSSFLNKKKNPNQRIVVFTECIATQNMLYECLEDNYPGKVLKVTADNRKDLQDVLDANFDANYKGEKQDKYKILITTDVLSEGVNLHRANTLINYDSPWNSTRLMQRLGRINRIGSTSSRIYSYNFYPSSLGDDTINLFKRTLVKLQAFHNMFGEDSQIYTTDEELVEIERPNYDEMESLNPNIEFITDLKHFKETNPERYKELSDINKTVATSVCGAGKECYTMVQDCFFKFNISEAGNFLSLNQLDFCRNIKLFSNDSLCELPLQFYKDNIKNCKDVYAIQKGNEAINIKSGGKNKEARTNAIKKLQKIKKDYLSNSHNDLFERINASVRSNNAPLIRRINNENCENLLSIEPLLIEWANLTSINKSDTKTDVKIEFICK